ncbi:MAG: hypothetical protein J7483_06765 [Novosphingobium sp.]|nr:hypothetical protein [Novosphingobium sp.]
MDLIDRYLGAIRWNLPGDVKADDVLAELHDLIASRIEDREENLGRRLRDDEISALLRDFGHPLAVAARYGKQQWLIGPEIFPFYWFSLKVVMAICVAIQVINVAGRAILGGGHGGAFVQGLDGTWWSLLGNAGLVTLIFAVIERTGWLTHYFEQWRPDQLPDLSELRLKPIKPRDAGIEAIFGIAFILWWVGVIHVPVVTDRGDFRIVPDPVLATLWWPILALVSLRLIHSLVQWLRPRWKWARGVLSLVTTIGGLAILALLYQAGHWATVISAGMPIEQAAKVEQSLNLSLRIAIIVVGLIWALTCLGELWRLVAGQERRG